jgi:hypothetical protein
MNDIKTGRVTFTPRRLTEAEVEQALKVIRKSQALRESMRARRGGQVMAESVELIREAREQRSLHALETT